MAAYPHDKCQNWKRLSNLIGKNSLSRWLIPTEVDTLSGLKLNSIYFLSSMDSSLAIGSNTDNSNTSPLHLSKINFTPIDLKNSFPSGSVGITRTKYSIDKSFLLQSTIESIFNNGNFVILYIVFLNF